MLAIIILVAVFYVALNYAEKAQGKDDLSAISSPRVKSFEECESQMKRSW